MQTLKDVENILRDFGLTVTQAKIYIAIGQLGFPPVREIARQSKVRREQVYRILPQLEDLGLVVRGLDSPTRFRVIPMNEVLSLLLNKIRENADIKIADLAAKKATFDKNFTMEDIRLQNDAANPQFTLISEKHRILHQILTMIQKAQTTISIIYSRHKILQFFSLYEDVLADAQQRGVTIHIMTEHLVIPDHASSLTTQLRKFAWLNIRYSTPPLVHFIMVDDDELMLATSTNVSIGDHPKLWTTDEDILMELHLYFESTWKQAHDAREHERG